MAPYAPNQNQYQTNWLSMNIGARKYGVSRFRMYDVEDGRFTQRDFVRIGDMNRYLVDFGNPVKYVDAAGLKCNNPEECKKKFPPLTDKDWGVSQGDSAEVVRMKAQRAKLQRARDILEMWQKNVQSSCCPDKKLQRSIQDAKQNIDRAIGGIERGVAHATGRVGTRTGDDSGWQATHDWLKGVGDYITFGMTKRARDVIWGDDGAVINKTAYKVGTYSGAVVQHFVTAGLSAAARARDASALVVGANKARLAYKAAVGGNQVYNAVSSVAAGGPVAPALLMGAQGLASMAYALAELLPPGQCAPNDPRDLYRTMREGPNGGPEIGPSARSLGVRPGVGRGTDDVGFPDDPVRPNSGLSVAPDDPANLPEHRRPDWLPGGKSRDPLWKISTEDLPSSLQFTQDSDTHGVIAPSDPNVTVSEFQGLLESTEGSWERVNP